MPLTVRCLTPEWPICVTHLEASDFKSSPPLPLPRDVVPRHCIFQINLAANLDDEGVMTAFKIDIARIFVSTSSRLGCTRKHWLKCQGSVTVELGSVDRDEKHRECTMATSDASFRFTWKSVRFVVVCTLRCDAVGANHCESGVVTVLADGEAGLGTMPPSSLAGSQRCGARAVARRGVWPRLRLGPHQRRKQDPQHGPQKAGCHPSHLVPGVQPLSLQTLVYLRHAPQPVPLR